MCWSKWWNLERVQGHGQGQGSTVEYLSCCLLPETPQEPGGERSLERKYVQLEQKVSALEHRLTTTDEANQRLYNKWTTVEDRFQQLEGFHQGDTRALQSRCRAIEQRVEALSLSSFDRCDDIIIVEE